jgi:outer membrane protein OmpA-like peptidoglycan-associated protein
MGALGVHGAAFAQSFRLDRYRAAERGDDAFAARRLLGFDQGQPSFQLTLDYAHDPLVLQDSRGDEFHVVEHALTADFVGGAAVSDRVFVFAGIDAPLVMTGDDVTSGFAAFASDADGAGIGDVRVGGRFLIVGDDDDLFRFGADARVSFPLAKAADDDQAYRGEGSIAFDPELLAELDFGALAIEANAGVRVRKKGRWNGTTIGSEATYAAALSLDPAAWLTAHLEAFGALGFSQFGKTKTLPLEALLGAKVHDQLGFGGGLAVGTGVVSGIGTPDVRLIAQLGWTPPKAKPAPAPQPAPAPPAPVVVDRDRDGFLDADDQCPDDPEDRDGYQDDDGCTDPDNDADGVPDAHDGCPNEAEDRDQFQDIDGCPDLDNDADGVNDVDDACPLEKGEATNQGCPIAKIDTTTNQIEIREQVQFATGKDTLLAESDAILEAVRKVLADTPQIHKLRVEGHTDNRGKPATNLELSKRRALAVVKWLTTHGIDPARLDASGCGDTVPAVANDSVENRAKNRRVVFALVDTEGSGAAVSPAPKTCVPAKPTK